MDIVFINKLKVYSIVGIFDWERKAPQELVFDVQLAWDISKAAKSEDIDDALNYAEVANSLADFVKEKQFKLLETLLEQSAGMIMEKYKVPWLRISCEKTQVMTSVKGVGLTVERGDPKVLSHVHRAHPTP